MAALAASAVAVAEVRAETRVAARLQRQWEAKALQLQTEFEEMLGRVHAREKELKEKVATQDREIELLKKGLRSEHIATVDARKEAKEAREAEAAAAASAAAAVGRTPPPRSWRDRSTLCRRRLRRRRRSSTRAWESTRPPSR